MTGGGDGNPANAGSWKSPADASRRIVVHLDDRPLGDDDLFLDASLQPTGPGDREFRRAGEFSIFPDRSGLSDLAAEYAGAGRLGTRHHDPAGYAVGAIARPAGDRAQPGPADGDRAV